MTLKLDVIIATYNRSALLRRTFESLAAARQPPGLEVSVTIVDTSTDDTKQVVEEFQRRGGLDIRYVFEPRRGKSRALNTGIERSDADLIGLTDDDIEVAPDWFVEIERLFAPRWNELDFAGGKVLPRWEVPPPAWLEAARVPGALSVHDHGEAEIAYGESFEGQLTGAHGVIKLSALREVGPYNEQLGPMGGSLLGSEDDDMYYRLLRAGKRGVYCPRLVVYHRVPAYRLTKEYYRKWCYGWGVSQSLLDQTQPTFDGPRILGVPRYMYREAATNAARLVGAYARRDPDGGFAKELSLRVFAGFLYTRSLQHTPVGGLVRMLFGKRVQPATR